jgi:hypothetical protein
MLAHTSSHTPPSANGAPYTSMGRSPMYASQGLKAPKKSPRAEGPIYAKLHGSKKSGRSGGQTMSSEVTRKISTLPDNATALTKHMMNGRSLPLARHIFTEEHTEGIYLFRYSDDWHFAGDTWHQSMEDVFAQIAYEFGVEDLKWHPISDDEISALTRRK